MVLPSVRRVTAPGARRSPLRSRERSGGVVTAAQPVWIAVAAGVNLVVLVFQAARWLALVKPLAPGATLGSAFRAMITGFTVSAFVPARGGELARVEMFGRETGLPRMVVMGSVLLDTLVNASVLP